MIQLTHTSGATKDTISWAPVTGAVGFRFIVDGKTSHTWDPTRTTLTISKGADRVLVEALGVKDTGTWPSAPPPTQFGADLPARLPQSTGPVTNVSSVSALQTALSGVPNGAVINITQNLNGGGSALVLGRAGSSSAPITITSNVGVVLSGFAQILPRGSYLRLKGLEIKDGTIDGIKLDVSAHHIEIDGCHVHHNRRQGINVQPSPTDLQIWNCRIHNNGDPANGNLDHGIYFGYGRGQCVIANCVVYDNAAYNIQVYPDAQNVIVTCCTLDGGMLHAQSRGGLVLGSESGQTDNNRIVGLLGTNAAWYAIDIYNPSGGDSGNQAFDSLGFGNGSGDFRTNSGITYTNCTHGDPMYVNRATRDYRLQPASPAIGKVQQARYGLVPPLDIIGNLRMTGDAGAYAG